jgi:biopolymer transport protein ExbD
MAGGGNESGEFGLQIAPMLDILFVLLLFFMVSAGSQQREAELGIKLPSRSTEKTPGVPDLPINIDITAEGQIRYNQSPLAGATKAEALKELQGRLKDAIEKFGEKQQVIIVPSLRTKHERVIDVLNACSAAKVKNLSFGVATS